jgi:DNA invertase Pin-like site-specific DNA recombinase
MNTLEGPPDTIPTVWVGIESGRADKGSPESQLGAIAGHAAATEGGRFHIGSYAESGKTGYKGERGPELASAINAAKAAAAEYGEAELWCFHTSRLARGSGRKGERSYMKLWADLFEADVQVRSVTDDEFAIRPMLVGFASEQNHKYSADLSAHVKRGKGDQRARGERPGGPINDGYTMEVVERDAKGKATKRRFDFNPTRQATIARMFELSLSGIPDARVGRTLNAEGNRTENGGYWDRRKVEDKVTNPVYCGAVVWYRGKPNEEVIWDPPTPCPAYITREQFESIIAMRKGRDKDPKAKRAGRKNKRHVMAKLADCERCGDEMRTTTSSWTRVDGTKNYSYICQHVAAGDGMCDAPIVNGEVADLELAEFLRDLFERGGAQFLERLNIQRDTERDR